MSDVEEPVKSNMMSIVAEGAKRLSSEPKHKKEPITPEILQQMHTKYIRTDGTLNLLNLRKCNFLFVGVCRIF